MNNFARQWTEETWEYRPDNDFEPEVDHRELTFIKIMVVKNAVEVSQVTIEVCTLAAVMVHGQYAEHIYYRVGDLQRWVSPEHFGRRFEQMTWSEMIEHFVLEEQSRG